MSDHTAIDCTHDPQARSWVESANEPGPFPIQNLPLGVFRHQTAMPKCGVAIGSYIADLDAMVQLRLIDVSADIFETRSEGDLSRYFTLPGEHRSQIRRAIFNALCADSRQGEHAKNVRENFLLPAADCEMSLPMAIGDYTDFYAGIHHAHNGGKRMGRKPPLPLNYHAMPIAYHGRASTIHCGPGRVHRPLGQVLSPDGKRSALAFTSKLDFELELGAWIGPGNLAGASVPTDDAENVVAGLCLLNDLSARDFQSWEMVPLGPFLSKNFATVVSPWIVTLEALAPFRAAPMPRDCSVPPLLSYLDSSENNRLGAFSIALQVDLSTEKMREQGTPPKRISQTNASHLYWTFAQMIAHHTVGGCQLRTGDLIGSGTISAPQRSGYGSLAELTCDGAEPILLPSGETRTYLRDGDRVTFSATASSDHYVSIGFGQCVVEIAHAKR